DVDGALALDHPSRDARLRSAELADVVCRAGAHCTLGHVETLDVQALLRRFHAQHAPALAAVLAGQDSDPVARADPERPPLGRGRSPGGFAPSHQRTSGAREMIFMKLRSRSSRATGPNTRVPRGLFWSSMITAAFSSNAM